MEERLRGTNDFLRNVLNSSSSISIIGTDLTGTVEFWNTGAENLFGYSAAEMVARMSISLLYPPDEPETATIVDEIQRIVIRGKRTISRELRELRKDGKKLWVRVTVSPRLNRDGTVIGLLGVGEDVTPRKELEQEARKSREVLESILSELSDAVFSLSVADGAVLRVNPATESLYGRSRAELLRMSGFWSAAIHPDDRAAVEEALLSLRSDGRMETRYRIVRPDGETRWVYDRRRVVGAPTRGTSRVDCLVTDVTGQKHAEERIENSLREKELLLREIHHRVKNNLSTVSSLLSLQEQYSHGKEAAGILREAMTRIRSMVLIHERLYQSASLSEIDAGDYVRSVTNHLLRLYGPRNVVVEHDIEPLGLDIDTAIPCGLIINELVSNALKYAFPDGQGGTVHVRMHHREPDGFILEVADTGVGIPDPTLVTRRDSLGMNLVHMLAEQLDGTVEIATASGTRVRIVAPVLHRKRRQS
jgi:PAS domain S-box-containing protein